MVRIFEHYKRDKNTQKLHFLLSLDLDLKLKRKLGYIEVLNITTNMNLKFIE